MPYTKLKTKTIQLENLTETEFSSDIYNKQYINGLCSVRAPYFTRRLEHVRT